MADECLRRHQIQRRDRSTAHPPTTKILSGGEGTRRWLLCSDQLLLARWATAVMALLLTMIVAVVVLVMLLLAMVNRCELALFVDRRLLGSARSV